MKRLANPSEKKILWVLSAIAVFSLFLPFLHLLSNPERVLTYRDTLTSFLPMKMFWMKTIINEGALPQWNPYLYAGTPFFADLKSATLYPLNLVFLLFGQENFFYAFSWYIFLHFPIVAVGQSSAE